MHSYHRYLTVAAACAALALSGCTSAEEVAKNDEGAARLKTSDVKIAYLPKRLDQGYFQSEAKGVAAKVAELKIKGQVLDSRFDANVMSSNLDTAINQGAKGIIIVVPDQKLGPAVLQRAKAAGVTVLALDDPISDAAGKPAPFLGYDFKQIGADVGKLLVQQGTEKKWKTAEIGVAGLTFNEVSSCTERTDATKQYLLANLTGLKENQIFETNYAGANTDGGLQAMQGLLTSHPDVQHWLVYSCNEEGVTGAVRALEQAGHTKTSCGVGIGDGALAKIEMTKPEENPYCGNVFIDGVKNGGIAVQMMYDALTGGKPLPDQTLSPGTLVTRANASQVFGG